MTTAPPRTVAVFDLDGTLTRRDTLLPFLRRARGTTRTAGAVLVHVPLILRALLFPGRRQAAKEAVVAHVLAGQDIEALGKTAESYAEEVLTRRLRPRMLERVELHRRAGHELVMVSASPALYVGPVGWRLGFDAVLATRLELGPAGQLTGRITGLNCRGPEKVARLRAWMGASPVVLYAYGDSAGDRDLLAAADVACRLRRGRLPPLERAGPTPIRSGSWRSRRRSGGPR